MRRLAPASGNHHAFVSVTANPPVHRPVPLSQCVSFAIRGD